MFTSKYVYKIKRSAKTGEAYRFKARMIMRGFEMEKGVDFVDNFSPTPGLAVARLMMSIAIVNGFFASREVGRGRELALSHSSTHPRGARRQAPKMWCTKF